MRSNHGRHAFLLGVVVLLAPVAAEAIDVRFDPTTRTVSLDEVFDYDIFVTASPDTFNAFEFVLVYDSTKLTFIQRSPLALQVGPLMLGACSNGFHLFKAVGDTIRITYSLLCAGAEVTGPGVIYRLQFRAPSTAAVTDVRFVEARFADAGVLLSPVVTHDGHVEIGDITAVPDRGRSGASVLSPAFPNPTRSGARLSFAVGVAGPVRLGVFAADGHAVRALFDGWLDAGDSLAPVWDGHDEHGVRAPAGVYYVRLTTLDGVRMAKAVLLP